MPAIKSSSSMWIRSDSKTLSHSQPLMTRRVAAGCSDNRVVLSIWIRSDFTDSLLFSVQTEQVIERTRGCLSEPDFDPQYRSKTWRCMRIPHRAALVRAVDTTQQNFELVCVGRECQHALVLEKRPSVLPALPFLRSLFPRRKEAGTFCNLQNAGSAVGPAATQSRSKTS
jgi:hypothetical protein